jgi:hypothetical protein
VTSFVQEMREPAGKASVLYEPRDADRIEPKLLRFGTERRREI